MRIDGQVAAFVALVAVGLAAVEVAIPRMGPELAGFAAMWVPALAGIAVALGARGTLRGFGWGLGRKRYLAIAYASTAAACTIPVFVALGSGHGRITTAMWPHAAGHLGLPATPGWGRAMLLSVNILFVCISAAGEEIGWRGFLVPTLARAHGFWRVAATGGAIWFAFHLPALVAGRYGASPVGYPLNIALFAEMLAPNAVLMAWLRLRSGSLWPAVLAHGVHNSLLGELWASGIEGDAVTPWLVGEGGLLAPVVTAAIVATLLWADRGGRAGTAGASAAAAA